MPGHIARVDAASTDRSLVPSSHVPDRLRAEPMLLLWRRLIDTALAEAKLLRFGQPTDTAILTRWWIEDPDPPDPKLNDFRATFDHCCLLLELDPVVERARLLKAIDRAWEDGCLQYQARRLELRRRAILSTAGLREEMSMMYALLLVSQAEYEDTAGINRADPPNWANRQRKPVVDRIAAASA